MLDCTMVKLAQEKYAENMEGKSIERRNERARKYSAKVRKRGVRNFVLDVLQALIVAAIFILPVAVELGIL